MLDAFESGSTIRFLIPIAAAGPEEVRFLGKPSLLSRPMGVYANIFAEQNLKFEQSGEAITFQGPLKAVCSRSMAAFPASSFPDCL
ncbi:hypothetical protein [Allobaculum sp. Allo2]|uniref:hypothetical protein n=1 Tax=Allobaculum sp. Allo2 TaxID=2853432 RepID=UPI001F603DC9|nr:hypothetical protein [Allobaculum sp. Allo2]UNT93715.1 hypothetical protein KWG61_02910 [Allobaculum sp. Allo2]